MRCTLRVAAIFQDVKRRAFTWLQKNTKSISSSRYRSFLPRVRYIFCATAHVKTARSRRRERVKRAESLCASPSGSLLTCDGKKARLHCIVKLAHRKQSSHSFEGEERRKERSKKKKRWTRRGEHQRVQDSPRPSRCALYSHRLDHERRKTSQGRPVLRSFSLPPSLLLFLTPLRRLDPPRHDRFTHLLFLNEHLLSGKTVWQLARARTWSYTAPCKTPLSYDWKAI